MIKNHLQSCWTASASETFIDLSFGLKTWKFSIIYWLTEDENKKKVLFICLVTSGGSREHLSTCPGERCSERRAAASLSSLFPQMILSSCFQQEVKLSCADFLFGVWVTSLCVLVSVHVLTRTFTAAEVHFYVLQRSTSNSTSYFYCGTSQSQILRCTFYFVSTLQVFMYHNSML